MPLSCTVAIQSFISHFHQYSLVDPSLGNIPSWVWQGVSHWFRKLRRRVWHHRHLETEFHENNNISISHPDKHKRNWKIVSTINVTYAPIQINWAMNIASNYFSPTTTCLKLHHGLKCYGSSLWTTSSIVLCNLRLQMQNPGEAFLLHAVFFPLELHIISLIGRWRDQHGSHAVNQRWTSDMILTGPCCSFSDFLIMEWYNKARF